MGAKTHQKSIKKRNPRWMASWYRFFLDFGRFWKASWQGKWSQDRPKKASKKRWKQRGHQDDQKVAIRRSNPAPGRGSWVLGRVPPYPGGETRSPMTGLESGRRLDQRTCRKILRVLIVFKRSDSPANSWILLVIDVLSRVSGIIKIVVSLL